MSFDAVEMVFMVITFLCGGGGGRGHGDLLDTITTQQYWQTKQVTVTSEQLRHDAEAPPPPGDVTNLMRDLESDDFKTRDNARKALAALGPSVSPQLRPEVKSKDPEVAQVAAGLLEQFSKEGHARDVRRLMAIRTLGERKEQSALAFVQGLENSSEPFVATYARRAAAEIQGAAAPTVDARQMIAADAWLLPKDAGMVLQAVPIGWDSLTAEALAEMVTEPPAPGNAAAPPDKAVLTARIISRLVALADRVGDVRIDGATIGLSTTFDGDTGWFVTVIHGEYDPAAFAQVFRGATAGGEGETAKINGAQAVTIDQGIVVMPSSKAMVIVYGDDAAGRAKHAEEIVEAIKTGRGGLEPDSALGKLLTASRVNAVVWGASDGMASLKKEPMFAAFDQLSASAQRSGKNLNFTITGRGTQGESADAVKSSREQVEAGLKSTITEGQAEVGGNPSPAEAAAILPMLQTLQSIKTTTEGVSGTITGQVPPELVRTFVAEGPLGDLLSGVYDAAGAREP